LRKIEESVELDFLQQERFEEEKCEEEKDDINIHDTLD